MPKINKKDLSKTFEYYLEKDLVSKVQFKLDKVKEYHLSSNLPPEDETEGVETLNNPPEGGAAGNIFQFKKQHENKKKQRENAKK